MSVDAVGDVRPLDQLIARLITAAEEALASGDLDQARSSAEDVQIVDPDNRRAAQIITEVGRRRRAPSGERALMTILFSDLVGSTDLAGRLEPEAMRDLYQIYRNHADQAVERFGGHVVQYLGDGIMASFGYPAAHEDDACRAVHAGLALVAGMPAAATDWSRRHGVEPVVRVGVHTGPVVVAGLDAGRPKEGESIIGMAPNLAARLQSEADPGTVVVSDVTNELVGGLFHLRSLGLRELKGITRPVELFAVEAVRSAMGRLDAPRFRRAGLHGRTRAQVALVAAWEEVRTSSGQTGRMALISGEAGIGKSRLAAHLRDVADRSGGATRVAGCQPYYTNVPLWPIARMIERFLALGTGPDEERLELLVTHLAGIGIEPEASVPLLAPLIGIDDPPGFELLTLDPTTRLLETLAAITSWLAHLAAVQPSLLVVEDLHWADPTTMVLLQIMAEAPPPGFLTVMTTRDDSTIGWRDRVLRIPLGRLDGPTAAELVDELAEGSDLPAEVRRSIIERADGIPLFVEELTTSAIDEGLPSERLPYRLHELMTERLKSPGVDLRLAQVAATIGAGFPVATLARVAGEGLDIDRELAAMVAAGIIEPVGDVEEATFRFRHALLRDAAYETQVLDVRRQTHAAVADDLEAGEADAALLAHHLDLADDPDRAVPYHIAAAQEAEGRGAHVEATRLLTRAIELIERLPEGELRDVTELTARMLRALNVSSMEGYASAKVRADHEQSEVLTHRLGTRPEVVPSLIAIWAYWLTSGDPDTARRVMARIELLVDDPGLSAYRPEALACAGFQSLYYDSVDEAQGMLELAMREYRDRSPEDASTVFWPLPNDALAVTAIALATIAALRGDLERSAEWERHAFDRVEAIGAVRGPFSRAFVDVYAGFIRRVANDDDGARAMGADAVAVGHEYGYTYWVMVGSMYQAAASLDEPPDPDFLAAAIDSVRSIGHDAFLGANLAYLAELRATAGDLAGALATIEDALITVDKTGEELHRPELLRRRVAHRRALVGPGPSDAAEIAASYERAVARGLDLIALRCAIDLARLPEEERPGDWRSTLEEAAKRLAGSPAVEFTQAAEILGR